MSSTLDFLISMVIVFLTFSILVSGIVESWNTYFGKRGQFLWEGIDRIIGQTDEGCRLRQQLRQHPAITALSQSGKQTAQASYIPSTIFASALIDILLERGSPVRLEKFGLSEAIAQLPDKLELKTTLQMIVRREQGRADRVEAGLADYFDQCMDRVSGWYKRDAQFRSVACGILLAIVLNVDAIHIASALWSDRELARKTADLGPQIAQKYEQSGSSKDNTMPAALPVGWPAAWAKGYQLADLKGWDVAAACLGYLLMGFVCLIGAPAWYQLLSTLISLRASGPVPERSANKPLQSASAGGGDNRQIAVQDAEPPTQLNYLEQTLQPERLQALQTRLQVPPSGKFDAATRMAIQRIQAQYEFAQTGELTELLLSKLA